LPDQANYRLPIADENCQLPFPDLAIAIADYPMCLTFPDLQLPIAD
jgi:hypothetical protein